MEALKNQSPLKDNPRIQTYPAATNDDLLPFLGWSHIVACPGKVGLLVVTAARGSRAIVIDSESRHGPEHIIARETGQPFIDWSDSRIVDDFFTSCFNGELDLKKLGLALGSYVKQQFTIEKMTHSFLDTVSSLVDQNMPPESSDG
jgi:hypothetical protein